MPSSRLLKDAVYGQFARIGKAISAPKRLELLDLLGQAPRTVEALAALASLSVANASQHLKVLRAAQLVTAQKQGLFVEYRLADEDVGRFLLSLHRLAEVHLAEVAQVRRQYFDAPEDMDALSGEELLRRVRSGEVTVLDVRPDEEYRAAHIPGARSIPVAELKARLAELPKSREIVAYCRGPWCVMAAEAVAVLQRRGFTAHRMEQGVAEWRARGWRLESGRPGARG